MTFITNTSPRDICVRKGKKYGQELITIGPGKSATVDGFDPKKPFNKDLIETGKIALGDQVIEEKVSKVQEELKAQIEAAQNAVKQGRDAVENAKADLEKGETDAKKKKLATAESDLQAFEEKLGNVQDMLNAGK